MRAQPLPLPAARASLLRWLLNLALLLGGSSVARAATEVQLQVSAREIAVGDTLEVQLDAMSDDEESPTQPELVAPNGFEIRGPSVGSRQQVSISGFRMVRQSGISATWQLTATRAGVYSIGPASVLVAGRRQQAQPVQIRVVPEGQRPQRSQGSRRRSPLRSIDPFDPFGTDDNFDDLFDRLRRGGGSPFERLPTAPPELMSGQAPDPVAYLEARLDTQQAVVGQQVTLSIYAHGSQGLFEEAAGSREPSHPDFLAQRLVENGSHEPVYQYTRDGQRWIVVKVRETALFPLRPGRLRIGALEFGFRGRRYPARTATGLRRSSQAFTVDVSEPPASGRPAGYGGDVGDFQLSATVEPRRITVGGSIAVTARVQGLGRLPGALKLPEQSGVEWLEPTLRDDPSVSEGRVGGSRSFNYVVRLTRPGALELGRISLSFYDPQHRVYRVVPAELGSVAVDPEPAGAAAGAAAPAAPAGPKLSELVQFRSELRPAPSAAHWADRRGFWWSLGAPPAGVLCAAGLGSLRRRLRQRHDRREQSRATHAQRALSEARQAQGRGELAGAVSCAERALYLGIEWATALRARAFLRSELEARLASGGLPAEQAREAAALLAECGELRRAGSSPDAAAVRALLGRTEALVKRLLKRPAPAAAADAEEARA